MNQKNKNAAPLQMSKAANVESANQRIITYSSYCLSSTVHPEGIPLTVLGQLVSGAFVKVPVDETPLTQ